MLPVSVDKKKVLHHHPDKRRAGGLPVKDGEDDYFTCITRGNYVDIFYVCVLNFQLYTAVAFLLIRCGILWRGIFSCHRIFPDHLGHLDHHVLLCCCEFRALIAYCYYFCYCCMCTFLVFLPTKCCLNTQFASVKIVVADESHATVQVIFRMGHNLCSGHSVTDGCLGQ